MWRVLCRIRSVCNNTLLCKFANQQIINTGGWTLCPKGTSAPRFHSGTSSLGQSARTLVYWPVLAPFALALAAAFPPCLSSSLLLFFIFCQVSLETKPQLQLVSGHSLFILHRCSISLYYIVTSCHLSRSLSPFSPIYIPACVQYFTTRLLDRRTTFWNPATPFALHQQPTSSQFPHSLPLATWIDCCDLINCEETVLAIDTTCIFIINLIHNAINAPSNRNLYRNEAIHFHTHFCGAMTSWHFIHRCQFGSVIQYHHHRICVHSNIRSLFL